MSTKEITNTKEIMKALRIKNSWDKWSKEDKKIYMECMEKLKDEKRWYSGYDNHGWSDEIMDNQSLED